MDFLLLLTFILTPTYIIRFGFFHLLVNLLMVWVFLVWIIFGIWLIINKRVRDFVYFKLAIDQKVLIPLCLFLLAGLISLFAGGISQPKLGQFIVLFIQPISLFFIAGYIFKQNPKSKDFLLSTFYFLLVAAGLYAAVQYFALLGLPQAWWGNSQEPKRAISFFIHPNFYALWSAPLLAFLIPDVAKNIGVILSRSVSLREIFTTSDGEESLSRKEILRPSDAVGAQSLPREKRGDDAKKSQAILKIAAWLIGALGLLLSLSRSGWLGLAVAIGVYLIVAADSKTRKIILAGVVIAMAIVVYYPNLRYRVLMPFYGEKSAVSRVELWQDGIKALKKSPVLGLGLTGFAKSYGQLNTDPSLDTHNFPHNIFLNFWTETGLLGLISFIWLIGLCIYRGLRNKQPQENGLGYQLSIINYKFALPISLFLIAFLFQGMVDNPYFKNDLALVFWVIMAFIL